MPKENKPTLAFVVVMLMVVVVAFLSEVDIHPWRLVGYACALIFEFWAIANKRKGDTISEGFWELSARPFVPWCCGALFLYYTMNGTITDVREIAALAGLQMHFFWQADGVYREASAKEPAPEPIPMAEFLGEPAQERAIKLGLASYYEIGAHDRIKIEYPNGGKGYLPAWLARDVADHLRRLADEAEKRKAAAL